MARAHNLLLTVAVHFAVLLSTAVAWASPGSVWVVDDDGGPGVDFVTVQDAVLAARAGDTIEVAPGSYAGAVSITSGITLTGRGSAVFLQGLLTVQGIPAGERVVLNKLELGALHVVGCTGRVTLIGLRAWPDPSKLEDSEDVRLSACVFYPTLRVEGTTAEFIGCTLRGADESGSQSPSGSDGGTGLDVGPASQVVLIACSLEGGGGADGSCFFGVPGGYGGDGLRIAAGSEVRLDRCDVVAGYGGEGCSAAWDGPDGTEVVNHGILFWIGSAPPPPVIGTGSMQLIPSDAPLLSAWAQANLSGSFLRVTVQEGNPGAQVTLLLGRRDVDVQVAGAPDRLRVRPTLSVHVGTLDQSGYLHIPQFALPPGLQPGRVVYLQALVTDHAGRRLSNGLPVAIH